MDEEVEVEVVEEEEEAAAGEAAASAAEVASVATRKRKLRAFKQDLKDGDLDEAEYWRLVKELYD